MNTGIFAPNKDKIFCAHLFQNFVSLVTTGCGTLGWIATQVQRMIVVIQLHMMLKSVLQLLMSLHEEEILE
jgi:hypothetical protein